MKDWISPVYAFFDSTPKIVEENGQWAHIFKRYLNKGDARSTGNMRKHIRSCWGEEVLKGKGKIMYSHHQHMKAETKYGFQSLMKTGTPEYYIPSKSTVSRDVRLVCARTRQRIAKIVMEYAGRLNFVTDAWTLPNHHAFIAVLVHLEHNGVPLCFPLDVVEVLKVGKSLTERMLLIQ
ncbi:uncharacterized protein F5147DRAFT_744660 [Suillus discolor]|uniref:Uncharacterized protein n=1 Tax=Suillus discolor TaxID=1912936 RepID=A0A9P7FA55_9AGAM|nr:uncharacterized protein F5147DRAFT_744660 [Suillus discolor]KAG2112007.1 hypothetical protein F5147DRAFT_744660 [Suillus discolor]